MPTKIATLGRELGAAQGAGGTKRADRSQPPDHVLGGRRRPGKHRRGRRRGQRHQRTEIGAAPLGVFGRADQASVAQVRERGEPFEDRAWRLALDPRGGDRGRPGRRITHKFHLRLHFEAGSLLLVCYSIRSLFLEYESCPENIS